MKCANCDAEIKDGSIYCPVCGKEAQMVNGYVSLEDDFLHSLLREGLNPKKNKRILSPEEQARLRKHKQVISVLVISLLLALLLAVGVVVKLFVDYKNDNSYEYQMEMAEAEIIDHNYESAMGYLARALAIVPEDIDSRMQMAELYLLQEKEDAAIVLLTEVIRLDEDYKEAYEYLIDIYAKKEQYEKIKSLSEYSSDREIKTLFTDYLVTTPTLYPSGDTFYDELNVTIFSVDDYAIYYTTDGTDPITNGKRYIEGVGITFDNSGLYKVKAVCKNKHGIYGDVITHNYQIVLTPETETQTEEVLEFAE